MNDELTKLFVGKIVSWPNRDETEIVDFLSFAGIGEIIAVISYPDAQPPMLVVRIANEELGEPPFEFVMSAAWPSLQFFDSIEAYRDWIAWIESQGDRGAVVRLVRSRPEKSDDEPPEQ
jgi:hypothetical protein